MYVIIYIQITNIGEIQMKRNMLNKIADWIEKIKVWIYNKKPSNKYLRIAYYFLTGLIIFILTIPIAIFVLFVIAAVLWFFKYLINFSSFRITMTLLLRLLFLLLVSLVGYIAFGDF